MQARTCATTGLRLVSFPGTHGYHVAKTAYPALSAASRDAASPRSEWGRYDVLGETFYLAETREGAYAEVLAPFKRANGSTDPLAKDAAALGMTLEEFVEEVARDWADRDFMGLGAVPAGWRYDRGMFRVEMIGSAELVHIEHPDSIAAIELLMGEELAHLGVSHLTTATLRSENRAVTTAIATALRAQLLDSGALPEGFILEVSMGPPGAMRTGSTPSLRETCCPSPRSLSWSPMKRSRQSRIASGSECSSPLPSTSDPPTWRPPSASSSRGDKSRAVRELLRGLPSVRGAPAAY